MAPRLSCADIEHLDRSIIPAMLHAYKPCYVLPKYPKELPLAYTNVFIYIYIYYVYVYMYICVNIYIYIHINTYMGQDYGYFRGPGTGTTKTMVFVG